MAASDEIVFEVSEAAEGGYDARALGYAIFTQGDGREDLKAMVRDAVRCRFDRGGAPKVIRIRWPREEAADVVRPFRRRRAFGAIPASAARRRGEPSTRRPT